MTSLSSDAPPRTIDEAALRAWPLPMPEADADKGARGRVLVVAGSPQMPGAALLAGAAALRAGAGKLVIATAAQVASGVAVALPEARVIALPETGQGGLAASGLGPLDDIASETDAVLIGPGMQDADATRALLVRVLPTFAAAQVILDALAIECVRNLPRFERAPLLTPHGGEMAQLMGVDKSEVLADPLAAAHRAATRWNALVALKGSCTVIAMPDGQAWRHQGSNPGLAISGSGDVLAGLIAGLTARGAPLQQAGSWGVALHARAGERLAQRLGPLGFMAHELGAEVPRLLHELSC